MTDPLRCRAPSEEHQSGDVGQRSRTGAIAVSTASVALRRRPGARSRVLLGVARWCPAF